MFELRGKLSKQNLLVAGILGVLVFIAVWWALAESFATYKSPDDILQSSELTAGSMDSIKAIYPNGIKVYPILPRPDKVFESYSSLLKQDMLLQNTWRSVWLNLKGYFWAIVFSIPLGFLIGLLPWLRGMFSQHVNALRYLPLSALSGLFITWFGIEDQMKIAFLAFGIIVYLLPVVVQRIDEVDDVYVKTLHTLGASNWDKIKHVFLPAVFSKLIDDIRVLTAISWTYIIIAELLNRAGGIGSLIFTKARQGHIEKVFAVLIVIILVGFIQDKLFGYLDRRIFPHKYASHKSKVNGEIKLGLIVILCLGTLKILQEIIAPSSGQLVNSLLLACISGAILYIIWGEVKLKNTRNVQA